MSFSLNDNQSVSFRVSGSDAAGNPVPLNGTPAYAVDDDSVLSLVDNGDGSGEVTATGKLGTAVLSVADTESNGQEFQGSVSIDVLAGEVTAVAIDLDTPVDNPSSSA